MQVYSDIQAARLSDAVLIAAKSSKSNCLLCSIMAGTVGNPNWNQS
jgi:hypothetical protein